MLSGLQFGKPALRKYVGRGKTAAKKLEKLEKADSFNKRSKDTNLQVSSCASLQEAENKVNKFFWYWNRIC